MHDQSVPTPDQAAAQKLLADSKRVVNLKLPDPAVETDAYTREAQNAVRAARASSTDALEAGALLNRVGKLAQEKKVIGTWTAQAQDSLRAAILFAGAGLDRSLKSLVETAIPRLIDHDDVVRKKFTEFAEVTLTDKTTQSINPGEFVRLFLQSGKNPEDVLRTRWVIELTSGSAQSAERVEELASALGVTESTLRARMKPSAKTRTALQLAFDARNLVAHELDVTLPSEESRKPLERIRAVRKVQETERHVSELLAVAQMVVNDVAVRLALT